MLYETLPVSLNQAIFRVEEQKSNIEAVKRLMRSASKSGGSSEFIMSAASTPDFLLIVESRQITKIIPALSLQMLCKTM
jgi:hypothetical protein